MSGAKRILVPGKNCWRLNEAAKASVLVDAKDYFQALVWACERAEKSINLLSWDIHSRIRLLSKQPKEGEFWSENGALPLSEFFLKLVEEKPQLEIRILSWGFIFLYANEREDRAEAIRRFRHPRIHFEFSRPGPLVVSHHQKIVVVDDELAFCGGLDVTQRRWDTQEHIPDSSERKDPGGEHYEPFHDVQLAVAGPVALDMGRIFRERWNCTTGSELKSPKPLILNTQLWPAYLKPDFRDHPIAISRTVPSLRGASVRECESLFLDSIKAAKSYIFVENQYLTSRRIGDALVKRLEGKDPPEILILVRLDDSKWTELVSVSVLRARLVKRLKRHDLKKRLLVLCPYASKRENITLNLHSKVFICDDRLLRIGSSNLCGRSEGMDTECDLTLEANGVEERKVIRQIRDRLLAEHLGISPERLNTEIESAGSMNRAVQRLMGQEDRTLAPCPDSVRIPFCWFSLSSSLVDPQSPAEFSAALGKLFFSLVLLIVLVIFFNDLKALANRDALIALAVWVDRQPLALLGLVALFAALTTFAVPLLLLALVFSLVLPPFESFFCSMSGALISATLVYFLGRKKLIFGAGLCSRLLEHEKVDRFKEAIHRQGIWPILLLRLVPIAPFWLENFLFGVMRVGFAKFFLATALALLPGFLLISYFEDQMKGQGMSLPAAVAVILVLLGWVFQKAYRHLAGPEQRADHR